MMTLFWVIIFIVSLLVLVKGADWLLTSSEKIGKAIGLSSFVVGVIIVGIGTSLPELFSSFVAVLKDTTEIVPANAIGSNIANILLVVGISALVGKKLVISKNLIDLELPLLAVSTVIFLGVVWDGSINFWESLLLVITYGIYMLYTIFHKDESEEEKTPEQLQKEKESRPRIVTRDIVVLIAGVIGLVLGANYLIDSVIALSQILHVAVGAISITAVALGTSLPELLVSVKAALRGQSEVAIGNIFGSNAFNIMMVVGIPGLVKNISLDSPTFTIGVPALAVITLLFIISGISKKIHMWEGAFYLALYVLFIAKLFQFF
jgi:cation:H+ antiporter